MAIWAKPGKGGILPGGKVTAEIAAIRNIPAGQDSLSPNRHPEVDNASALLDLIERIRRVTGKPTGFKAVIGAYGWLDEMLEEVRRRGADSAPDFITVDSGDGGTGAAPMPLLDNVGLPVRESLPLVVDRLTAHGLRQRIRVIVTQYAKSSLQRLAEVRFRLGQFAHLLQQSTHVADGGQSARVVIAQHETPRLQRLCQVRNIGGDLGSPVVRRAQRRYSRTRRITNYEFRITKEDGGVWRNV